MSVASNIGEGTTPFLATYASIQLLFRISALAVLFSIGGYVLYYGFLSPLASIPGPIIARFTKMWVAYHAWKGDLHVTLTEVHEKYGEVVRIGPDEIITTSPEAIKKIYGAGSKYDKSNFYAPMRGARKWDIMGEKNHVIHRNNRRLVNSLYTTSALVDLEPYVDNTIQHFMNKLRDRTDERLDLGIWVQLFAFDVIGEVTFSQKFGLLDIGEEPESLKIIKRAARSTAWVGNVPWVFKLHELLSPVIGNHLALNARHGYIPEFTMQQAQSRILRGSDHRDMLGKLIEINKEKPNELDNFAVIATAASNVFAGSDTTAVSLRSMFYHLLKSPECMQKLLKEIDEATAGMERNKPVTFEQANNMPYLQAVMNEALRIHPIISQSLSREVPEQGLQIDQYFLPKGTVVGTSPYVLGRSEHIYGDDAKIFRPERWLEEERRDLQRGNLAFGGPSRLCLGKNLAWMEMSKVLPTLLRNFVVELADPNAELKMSSYFIVLQTGLEVRLRSRTS